MAEVEKGAKITAQKGKKTVCGYLFLAGFWGYEKILIRKK